MYRTLAAFILLLMALSSAHAQEVRTKSPGLNTVNGPLRRAAINQGRIDWPVKRAGEIKPGTQVKLTFDLSNADIDVVTDKAYSVDRLLETARLLAKELEYPKADFIREPGEFGNGIDIELNDYLVKPEKNATRFSLDLARLAEALKKTDLPEPIVIAIHPKHSKLNTVTLSGKELTDVTFFGPDQVPPGSQLSWRAQVHWSGWIAVVVLPGFLIYASLMPWFARKKPELPKDVPSPEDVQQTYDKSRPMVFSVLFLIPLLASPFLLTMTSAREVISRAIESATSLVPVGGSVMMALPLVMLASFGGSMLYHKRQARQEPKMDSDPDEPPTWTKAIFLTGMIPVLIALMVLGYLLSFGISPFRSLPVSWRANTPLLLLVSLLIVGGIPQLVAYVIAARKVRTTLKAGDAWYDRVQAIARHAGVRVKHVVVIKSTQPNAYASIWGTVGLTSKLLREFTTEEIITVVAHEIGHHRKGHVKRGFWISLGVTFLLLGGWWLLRYWLEKEMGDTDDRRIWLNSPIIIIVVLPLLRSWIMGRGQREREFEADRFAVQITGNPELVIRTLTRMHTLNAMPFRLKPADEAVASHPSLERRVARIREEAGLGR